MSCLSSNILANRMLEVFDSGLEIEDLLDAELGLSLVVLKLRGQLADLLNLSSIGL